MTTLLVRSHLPFPADDVFAWHLRPGALERLTPPWLHTEVLARHGGVADGGRVTLGLHRGPFMLRWQARHRDVVPGRQFVDEQLHGPFHRWVHTHRFSPSDHGCTVEDEVRWELPLGALGGAVAGRRVQAELERMFDYRHAQLAADLLRHAVPPARATGPLRVAVSGASGLIGRALCAFLSTGGHEVVRLVRGRVGMAGEIAWDPERGLVAPHALSGVDAVVHLAGENVGARWTAAKRRAILDSRVAGTRTLAEALARLPVPPRVFVSASAIGWYGDRGDEPVDETSAPGSGFLAEVCQQWETAAAPAARAGVRVVHPRIGVVLTPAGGALARMLPAFRMGVGGPIGGGAQAVSWIALDDVVYALHRVLVDDRLRGPVDLTAPAPVTQRELAHALGRALGRPSSLPLPRAAVSALFGQMGREVLLAGARVLPARLGAVGFRFRWDDLDAALAALLGRAAPADLPLVERSWSGS